MATHRGGSGNFAENRERAAEAGRKGVRTAAAILKMTHNAPHVLAKKADAAVIKNLLMPNPLLPPGNTGG